MRVTSMTDVAHSGKPVRHRSDRNQGAPRRRGPWRLSRVRRRRDRRRRNGGGRRRTSSAGISPASPGLPGRRRRDPGQLHRNGPDRNARRSATRASGSTSRSATNVVVGGDACGEANVILDNRGGGVQVGFGSAATRSAATGSSATWGRRAARRASGSTCSRRARSARRRTTRATPTPAPTTSRTFRSLTSATPGGGGTRVIGTLNSTASSSFTLDFYANPSLPQPPARAAAGRPVPGRDRRLDQRLRRRVVQRTPPNADRRRTARDGHRDERRRVDLGALVRDRLLHDAPTPASRRAARACRSRACCSRGRRP